MDKQSSLLFNLTEPFNLFYLGVLASVGLAFGSSMMINIVRELTELYFGVDLTIYSRTVFSVFYIYFLIYTYRFLNMKQIKALRNGFLLFTVIYILGQIYIWLI